MKFEKTKNRNLMKNVSFSSFFARGVCLAGRIKFNKSSVANATKSFCLQLKPWQNKLECLYSVSTFRLVLHLRVRARVYPKKGHLTELRSYFTRTYFAPMLLRKKKVLKY